MKSCPQLRIVHTWRVAGLGALMILVGANLLRAQEKAEPLFRDATFEELAAIIVSTASRQEEPIAHVSAAITVVTSDDIQRSGAALIPQALQYVPGLEVAQINAHDWAISARGFNSRYANKQLVLEDGRSLYSPFSGGVFWEAIGPPLAEIQQIEIIRGPGGTVWGANAMNGVINIVTKSARDTQGGVVSVSGGRLDKQSVYAGYGFRPASTPGRAFSPRVSRAVRPNWPTTRMRAMRGKRPARASGSITISAIPAGCFCRRKFPRPVCLNRATIRCSPHPIGQKSPNRRT